MRVSQKSFTFLIIWTIICIAAGLFLAQQIHDLGQVSENVSQMGEAVDKTAEGIRSLEDLPFVGGEVEKSADGLESTANKIQALAKKSQDTIFALSIGTFLLVALLPTVPLWFVFVSLARKQTQVQAIFAMRQGDITCEQLLAHRAVFTAPYKELFAITKTPWQDLNDKKYHHLAQYEAQRLGIKLDPDHQ